MLANPDDDLPRLVYADRLDELGDHPRAEFIRLQIHVANTKPWDEGHADALVKSEVLFERHKEAWGIEELIKQLMQPKRVTPGMFNPFVRDFIGVAQANLALFSSRREVNPFVRGFPEVTWAAIETFSAAHRKALKKYPIREMNLIGGPSPAVARSGDLLAEVAPRRVNLDWTWWNVFPALTAGPPLPSLRSITLSRDMDSADVRVIGEFAASGNFPNVEEVRFGHGADEDHLIAFIRWLRWPKVRDVYLSGPFTPRVMDALTAAGWVERAERLRLAHEFTDAAEDDGRSRPELSPLLRSERLSHLRSLSVEAFTFPPSVERAFARSTLGPLDHFEIDGWCDPPVRDYRGLLSSPALRGVKSLDLPGADTSPTVVEQLGRNGDLRRLTWDTWAVSPEAWAGLASSPASQSLRRMELRRVLLNGAVVRVLLAGRPWPHLAELMCKSGTGDGRAVAKLIDHPHFARLTHLDIEGGTRAADLWKALAKSKTVGRFHKLRLGFAVTDTQLNAILDNPAVCKVGHLALPNRVKIGRKTQRRYEKVFGVRVTRDY